MANFFDQFDNDTEENFFDQFDSQPAEPVQTAAEPISLLSEQPAQETTFGEDIKDLGVKVGTGAMDLLATGADIVQPDPRPPGVWGVEQAAAGISSGLGKFFGIDFLEEFGERKGAEIAKQFVDEDERRAVAGEPSLEEERQSQFGTQAASFWVKKGHEFSEKNLSESQKALDKQLGEVVNKGAWATAKFIAENPSIALSTFAESLPAMLFGGGVGRVGKVVAGRTGGVAGSIAGESGVASALNARQAQDVIQQIPGDQLIQLPEAQDILSANPEAGAETIRSILRDRASNTTFAASLMANVLVLGTSQSLGANVVQDVFAGTRKKTADGIIKRGVKGFAGESGQEFVQESSDAISGNLGEISAGVKAPEQLTEGAPGSGVLGAAAGGPAGGIGNILAGKQPEDTPLPPATTEALDLREDLHESLDQVRDKPSPSGGQSESFDDGFNAADDIINNERSEVDRLSEDLKKLPDTTEGAIPLLGGVTSLGEFTQTLEDPVRPSIDLSSAQQAEQPLPILETTTISDHEAINQQIRRLKQTTGRKFTVEVGLGADKETFTIDTLKDDMLTVLAKRGGLNRDDWVRSGVDPEAVKDKKLLNRIGAQTGMPFGKPLFRAKDGWTVADVADFLVDERGTKAGFAIPQEMYDEHGKVDDNDVVTFIGGMINGTVDGRYIDAIHLESQVNEAEKAIGEIERANFEEAQLKLIPPEHAERAETEPAHAPEYYPKDWGAEARALADWMAAAEEVGVPADVLEMAALKAHTHPVDAVRELTSAIDRLQESNNAEATTDRARDTGPRPENAETGTQAETPDAQTETETEASQELDPARPEQTTEEAPPNPLTEDVGEQQAVADKQREKDEKRSGKPGKETPEMEAGAGDLFAGPQTPDLFAAKPEAATNEPVPNLTEGQSSWQVDLTRPGRENVLKRAGIKDADRLSRVTWNNLTGEQKVEISKAIQNNKAELESGKEGQEAPEKPVENSEKLLESAILINEETNETADSKQDGRLDLDGEGSLAGTPTRNVRKTPGNRPSSEGSGTGSTADSSRDESANGSRSESAPGMGSGEADLFDPPARTEDDRARNKQSDGSSVQPTRGNAGSESADQSRTGSESESERLKTLPTGSNYVITASDNLGSGGAKTKFKDNIAAIELLKELEADGRTVTPEDQATLARYVGWGGIPQAFEHPSKGITKGWEREVPILRDLLTDEEMQAAAGSTLNAHFTSPDVINGIYQALDRFGFRGGRVLEPAVGTGNFFGLMPANMRSKTRLVGVELDSLTGRIADKLYPSATIHVAKGFEEIAFPENTFDLVTGNPPFGNYGVTDLNEPDISGWSIHNYFFGKSIKKAKPGGMVAMVVSRYLMDAKNSKVRKYIDSHADFIGALRLPETAFKKNALTDVVTDIIFLQKREPGAERKGENWLNTENIADPLGGEDIKTNEYFVKNPSMMLGTWERSGTMSMGDSATLKPLTGTELSAQIEFTIRNFFPENIIKHDPRPARNIETPAPDKKVEVETKTKTKVYGYFTKDGVIYRRLPDVVDADGISQPQSEHIEPANIKVGERIIGAIGVRDALNDLLAGEIDQRSTTQRLDALRAQLNRKYDTYRRKFGYFHDQANLRAMREDPDIPRLLALETDYEKAISPTVARKTGQRSQKSKAGKADIFRKPVAMPATPPDHVDTSEDGLTISLNESGRINLARIAELTDKTEQQVNDELVEQELIFLDPVDGYVTRDEYLSGNVKRKLAEAQNAAKEDTNLYTNVQALVKVQPEDIEAVDISTSMGSPWIPPKTMQAFIKEISGADSTFRFVPALGQWEGEIRRTVAYRPQAHEFATDRYAFSQIVDAAVKGREIRITNPDPTDPSGKKRVLDQQATTEANQKKAELQEEFSEWLWQDQQRRDKLVRLYNDSYNTQVDRKYDGAFLTFPGMNTAITMEEHQSNGAWRLILDGYGLMDHTVGAGKTFLNIAAIMEKKRMGLVNKPMIVVPNHLVDQWAKDVAFLYPNANVLAATKKDFEKKNRQKFLAKISTGNWDAVIIAHSSFERIETSPEDLKLHLQKQKDQIVLGMQEIEAEEGKAARSFKELQKLQKSIESKLEKVATTAIKDGFIQWRELGVDDLNVDEAHEFKNLFYVSKRTRIAGLGDPKGSRKAFDLFIKTEVVREINGGNRGVTFLTGTPISNSIAEMYTMFRYVSPNLLRERNIELFDGWAAQFAEITADWELDATAQKYALKERFRKFQNIPELMGLYKSFADTITLPDLKEMKEKQGKRWPTPKLAGGKPENVIVNRTDQQEAYMADIVQRAMAVSNKSVDPTEDNMLKITNDARLSALDMRIMSNLAEDDPDSKPNVAVRSIKKIHDEWNTKKGTQLVFMDLSTPKGSRSKQQQQVAALIEKAKRGDAKAIKDLEKIPEDEILSLQSNFSVYDDMRTKLIASGIPAAEIAFIHEYNTDLRKAELFASVRTGKIRILFGSTFKMGAGMNVQNKLVALHHMDAPWRPSDLQQREGRIIRRGNEFFEADPDNFEIKILRYSTEATYDARMWQIIEGKAKFVEQMYAGATGREIDDIAGEAANASEMKAIASGNPLMLEQVQLSTAINKLQLSEKSHKRRLHQTQSSLNFLEKDGGPQGRYEKGIQAVQKKISIRDANPLPKEFSLEVDGRTYTKPSKAGEAIKALVTDYTQRKMFDAGTQRVKLFTYRGFDAWANTDFLGRLSVHLQAAGVSNEQLGTWNRTDTVSGDGLLQRAANIMKQLDVRSEDLVDTRARELEEIKVKSESVAKPFKGAEELKTKKARLNEVLDILKSEDDKTKPEQGDEVRQSKSPGPASGLDVDRTQAVVNKITKGKRAAKIKVLDSASSVEVSGLVPLMTAWHGTPHSFDRFSLDHIGSGEGAQAYGHGLYFAESKGVANTYIKPKVVAGSAADDGSVDLLSEDNLGSIYEVEIPDEAIEQMLDWDIPLNEQPEHILKAFDEALSDDDVYQAWKKNGAIKSINGSDAYKRLTERFGDYAGGTRGAQVSQQSKASKRLNELGIPGIKYADGTSRVIKRMNRQLGIVKPLINAVKGKPEAPVKHNIVLFDEKHVSIKSRNGRPLHSEAQGGIEGMYDPASDTIYLFADQFSDEDRVKWVTWHELWHRGARVAFGDVLDSELRNARTNKVVNRLANAVYKDRDMAAQVKDGEYTEDRAQLIATDEALAELDAAMKTENYQHIEDRYKIKVPAGMKSGWRKVVADWIEAIKRIFGKIGISNKDVREIIHMGSEASGSEMQGQSLEGEALASTSGSNVDQSILDRLNKAAEKADAFISQRGDTILLHDIVVPKGSRREGIGGKFMEELTQYADDNGLTITLTAAGDLGGSKTGQQRFYKRHGFVMNAGRNKDYRISENMLRRPKANKPEKPLESRAPKPDFNPNFSNWSLPTLKLSEAMRDDSLSLMDKALKGTENLRLNARQWTQDKMIPVLRIEKAIKKSGGTVSDFADVYEKEQLLSGRVEDQFRQMEGEDLAPLVSWMSDNKVSRETLGKFLYARHAEARNERIAEINEKFPDGGSGMETEEAHAILKDFYDRGMTPALTRMAEYVDRITEKTRENYKRYGLIKSGVMESWDEASDFNNTYVPLRGFADSLQEEFGRPGKGFDIRGSEVHQALGRKSKAGDIIGNVLSAYKLSIIRGEKNRVGQALLRLAKDNPNDNLWKISPVKMKTVIDKETGMTTERADYQLNDPNVFYTKVNGKAFRIELRDERLAVAMKNLGADSMGAIMRGLSTTTRYLSMTRTMLSPEFIVTNFMRDIQTAGINLTAEQGKAIRKAAINRKAITHSMRAMFNEQRGKSHGDPEWLKYAREYTKDGGRVAFFRAESVEELARKVDRMNRMTGDDILAKSYRGLKATFELIEDLNLGVENAVRLAAYKAARENGMTRQKAAVLAKNLTVNFNRKGLAGPQVNAVYMFANASMQGAQRMLQASRNPRVQKVLMASALFGTLMTLFNELGGGEDDDGESFYSKIPDFEKGRKFILMIPDGLNEWVRDLPFMNFVDGDRKRGAYLTFHLPYGYSVPYVMGEAIGSTAFGTEPTEAAVRILGAINNSFNPVGGSNAWTTVAPTLADPFIELLLNRNFWGGPIHQVENPFDKTPAPKSSQGWRNTNGVYKYVATKLNEWSDGNEIRPGKIDLHPETYRHFLEFATGGTGSFVERVVDNVSAAISPEREVEVNRLPFVRQFFGTTRDFADTDRYYSNVTELGYLKDEEEEFYNQVQEGEMRESRYDQWKDDRKDIFDAGLIEGAAAAEKEISKLRKYLKAERNTDPNSDETKQLEKDIINRQREFNTEYNKTMLDKGWLRSMELPKPDYGKAQSGISQKTYDQVAGYENYEPKVYKDDAGANTIGFGSNLDESHVKDWVRAMGKDPAKLIAGDQKLSKSEAGVLLNNGLELAVNDVRKMFDNFDIHPEPVQRVLTDMSYNMGYTRLRKFKRMIAAVDSGDYKEASKEMKDSRWYNQTGRRARYLVKLMGAQS